jgi:putative peptidoglycan binding protein
MQLSVLTARYRRLILLCGALLLVSACQSSQSAPTPVAATSTPAAALATAAPTIAARPTSAPQPTAAPAPTIAPQPTAAAPAAVLLPAPVYLLDGGQIWRMERDGQTRRQLTFESSDILDFAIGATDNALAYVVGESPERTIVLLDRSGRTELMRGPVWGPQISPSGEQIAFQLEEPVDGLQIGREKGSDTGVWLIARAGGRPSLLQASEPISDAGNLVDSALQYYPREWSPDGTQLLMGVYFPVGEGGYLAVKDMAGGQVTEIPQACCEASWSADGAAVIIAGGTQIQDAILGLWRADPRSGATTELIGPSEQAGSPLVTAARQLADGSIYAFLTITKDPSFEGKNKVTPQRVQADGSFAPVRPESYLLAGALWADDASGAIVADAGDNYADWYGRLSWLPLDGGPAIALAGRGSLMRWGNAAPQPADEACGRFHPIAWDPPAIRNARPEVLDLQRRLLALGYSQVGPADGFYGDQTRAAVLAFQQASSLPASGDVDCATWAALLGQ